MSWVGVTLKESIGNTFGHNNNNHHIDEEDQDMNLHEVDLERVDEDGQPIDSVGEVGAPSQRFRHIKNRKYMRRLYFVLAALACIFVFSALLRLSINQSGSNKDNNDESNSNKASSSNADMDLSGASKRLSHLLVFMNDNHVDEGEAIDLANASSAQRFALEWIADEDPMQIEVPETRFDETYHAFIQRYSAAVLTFAWGLDKLTPLGFLSEEHICNWNANYVRPDTSVLQQGIICNGDQNQVVKVVLQTIGISGSIPREIGHLHSVQHLHLDGNDLTGKLPNMMHRMQELRELTITRNQLTGHLPPFMSKMSSLRHVELSKNMLSGHLAYPFSSIGQGDATDDNIVSPIRVLALDNNKFNGPLDVLKKLKHLEELYVNDNDLTGHFFETFVNSSKLAILDASSNKMAGKVPDYLLQLPSMTILDLHSNSFADNHPHGNSTVLKFLDMHDNLIEGPVPRSIGSHPNLAYLDLSQNQLTSLPNTMGKLQQMQFLFLAHNPTLEAGPLPEWILELPVLTSLSFKNTARIGALPEWLGRLSQLSLLDLELNLFNSSIPASISGMTSAEYIFLNHNELVGGVPASLGNLTDLVLLNLDHNGLTGIVPSSVCAHDFEVLVTDCATSDKKPEPAIECACCTKCCMSNSQNCNTRDWSGRYGDDWGDYYERFNIINDGDVYELEINVNDGSD